MPGKKSRLATKVATAVVGAAGACVLLAACSTIKMGSAAVVGDQRISTATLDSQVSSLQATAQSYHVTVQTFGRTVPQAVLGWKITFAIRDRMSRDAGVSVTARQVQDQKNQLDQAGRQQAATNGSRYQGTAAVLASIGIPQEMATDFYRWEAQLLAFVEKDNGGRLPTAQADVTKALAAVNTADCRARKALAIQVNPQFGQLGYDPQRSIYTVVAGPDTLSRLAGRPSPASTAPPSLPGC